MKRTSRRIRTNPASEKRVVDPDMIQAGAPIGPALSPRAVRGRNPRLILGAVAAIAFVTGDGTSWPPLLAVGPARPPPRAAVGGAADRVPRRRAGRGARRVAGRAVHGQAVVLSTLIAVTLASCLASVLRRRRERVLAAVRSVAEAAQNALLRPVPARVGQFQVAVRYSAAAAEAGWG